MFVDSWMTLIFFAANHFPVILAGIGGAVVLACVVGGIIDWLLHR